MIVPTNFSGLRFPEALWGRQGQDRAAYTRARSSTGRTTSTVRPALPTTVPVTLALEQSVEELLTCGEQPLAGSGGEQAGEDLVVEVGPGMGQVPRVGQVA